MIESFLIDKAGLSINPESPHSGAFLNGSISSNCCGLGVLEFKYHLCGECHSNISGLSQGKQ